MPKETEVKVMQEMTHQHTRELDIYYNEHRKACTNCGKQFQDGMTAHLGYLADKAPVVLCDDCSQLLSETVVRYYWMKPKYEEVLPTAKLWRYMDLSKFISLIGKKKLYFPSLESFEDIFEGAKGIIERKGIWNEFYTEFLEWAIRTPPEGNTRDLTDEYVEKNAAMILSNLERVGVSERKDIFVSCWHCNQYESEAMWKLYSTNVENAIAIQTTSQQLYEALGKDPSIQIGKVQYIDFTKRFSAVNGAYWYKRKSFEYEQEVRAVVKVQKANSSGIEKDIDIEKLIVAIYISSYAPKWFEDVVYDVVKKYGLNKPIFHSEMAVTPFY